MNPQRLVILVAVLSIAAHAQWLNHVPAGTPLTRDGKPNLAAPVPRAADGKPDLSGTWMHEITTVEEVKRLFPGRFDDAIRVNSIGMEIGTQHKYVFNILADFTPEDSPLRPETAELMRRRAASNDPSDVCVGVPGIPRADLLSEPIRIVQSPRETVIMYEAGSSHRQVYTDGRKLPKEFDYPAWLGYSVGHWERDTYVIESAGFNDRTPLDNAGHPHSEALRVTERYHRRDYGHLDIETTFDDPKMYTRPFTIKVPHELLPDQDIFEMFCTEDEKDRAHLQTKK
jgi:hypothetical protein